MDWAKKDAFFSVKVPVEEKDITGIGRIKIHGLTVAQKEDYENDTIKVIGNKQFRMSNARALLMLMTVHDQHGRRLFGDKDIARLRAMPAAVADPIIDVARRLSGMNAGEMEEMAKNLQTGPELPSEGSDTD